MCVYVACLNEEGDESNNEVIVSVMSIAYPWVIQIPM